jgi:peptidyl-dipeptidase Dcp
MPDDLMQKLLDAANFQAGYYGYRTTFQSLLDMKWHMTDPATISSVEDLEDSVVKDHSLFPRLSGPRSTGF